MKRLLLIFILLVLAYGLYVGWQTVFPKSPNEKSSSSPVNTPISTIQIGGTIYKIEVADTDDEKIQGLSGRDKLAADQGMLFTYATKDRYSFWMKGMRFPLDFVWIDGDTIADLTEDVPRPLIETYTPIVQPKVAVDKILEINAGEIKKQGFKIGDRVYLTIFYPEADY